ncbi:flagellar biosynthesis protein FlhF [Schlesneria paludicola]|uniref:flagellar biosynthesis protein FlhF n=1 Tax=Schlesneria paludicola TaxID=360056 RepID=UPI00029A1C3C|nr:flagellar biosynthesis protein FlhF [Schlesneria paludicola]
MQRRIQTFRAATIDEALNLVRRELGQDAVVVESKEVSTRRLLPWPSTRQEIEVSAEPLTRRSLSRQSVSAKPSSGRMVRTLAESMSDVAIAPQRPAVAAPPMAAKARVELETAAPSEIPGYQKTLESLHAIAEQLERQSRPIGTANLPGELFQYYTALVAAEIEDDAARELISKLRQHAAPDALNSESSVQATLTALIEREMRCAPPIRPRAGRREIVTLVGPTGVGKTTTLAKLAGHFHLHEGLRIGLITVDTYRVAAVEQLQTYAEILQVPLRAASNPEELRTAIDEMDDVDLILIDTAGRSPFDAGRMNELRELLRVANSNHVLLVLSLAAGVSKLPAIAEKFAVAAPTSLVVTKLDENLGGGGLLTVARDIAYPVSYLTTGQDVPAQIESAHPNRLARLILGLDKIHPEMLS